MNGEQRGYAGGGDQPVFGKLPPGPHRLPRQLVREHQRHRILQAALGVFSDGGFAAATVKDVIRAAHVSRATFYEIFADKEACLVALHEEILTWLWSEAEAAVADAPGWAGKVRAAVERTVELLAADPRAAFVCAIEAPLGPPPVRARHERAVEELCVALRAGRRETTHGAELPEVLEPALISGAVYVAGRAIVCEHGEDPGTLVAQLPELLLLPYRS